MMVLNALQRELVKTGLAEVPEEKARKKGKQFACKKCGEQMVKPDDTNIMYCPNCESSYFIFSK